MSTIGTRLKQAREAQNKTRAAVARETGILIHDLAALEYGSFDTLPDDETVAGFVKAYAECLGFRPDEPVAEFWTERGVESPPALEEIGPVRPALPEDDPEPPNDEPAHADDVEPTVPDAPALEARPPVETSPAPRAAGATARTVPWGWLLAGAVAVVLIVVALVATRGGPEPPRADAPTDAPSTTRTPEPAVVPTAPAADPTAESDDATPTGEAAAAEPAQEPAGPPPAEPVPAPRASALRVTEHGVGTGVRNRRLTGESDRFAPGRRVWFWTRVEGGRAGDRIRHVWIHDGREVATVELDVGSANWRTQSAKSLFESAIGRWAVEARDASGRVLARSEFVCGS